MLLFICTLSILQEELQQCFLLGVFQVACIYNDHSLYVWDVLNTRRVGKAWSFLFHSGCVWGLEVSDVESGHFVMRVKLFHLLNDRTTVEPLINAAF